MAAASVRVVLVESTGFVRFSPRVELAEAVHNLEIEHSAALMAVVKQVAAWRTNA
jgi:ABC-type enterochelin transport system ATPase subunit